jgi:MATE family multidrug resistance protein
MNTRSQREELRWRLKPFPELARLSWPIMVSMLSYSVMTLVDTVFAGRLGATAVGAVGIGGVATFTLLCFGIGLLQGAKVRVAQALGARRHDRVPGYVGASLVVAVTLGTLIAAFAPLTAWWLPLAAGGSASVRLAQRYVAIRLFAAPIVLVAFAIREVRCALGDSRSRMRAALVANTLHVPLNYAFIFTCGWGVTGAALSTVAAQTLEAALLVRVQKPHGFGLDAWSRREVSELWQTGWPLGVERLFNVASFATLVTILARCSDVDLAAHQVAHQVTLFALLPTMAIAEAASVLAGQAVGADDDAAVRRVARVAAKTGAAYGALCALAYVALGPIIASAVTSDSDVEHVTVRVLRVAATWQAFCAVYMVGGAVLRGAGDVRYATLTTAILAWIVTPPLALLLARALGWGAVGAWLALLAEWASGALVLFARVERGGWANAAKRCRERLVFEQHDWNGGAAELAPASGE